MRSSEVNSVGKKRRAIAEPEVKDEVIVIDDDFDMTTAFQVSFTRVGKMTRSSYYLR